MENTDDPVTILDVGLTAGFDWLDALTVILFLLPLLMQLYWVFGGAEGSYNPITGELEISINESSEYYDRVVFHEEKHRELNQVPGFRAISLLSHFGFGLLMGLSFLFLLPRGYAVGATVFWLQQLLIEMHAIVLTSLEFGTWNTPYMVLLTVQTVPPLLAVPGVLRMRRKAEGDSR